MILIGLKTNFVNVIKVNKYMWFMGVQNCIKIKYLFILSFLSVFGLLE